MINNNKPKSLRKLIQQHFKKYAVLGYLECMFKFFEILKSVYRFDQERYRCALGVSKFFYLSIILIIFSGFWVFKNFTLLISSLAELIRIGMFLYCLAFEFSLNKQH